MFDLEGLDSKLFWFILKFSIKYLLLLLYLILFKKYGLLKKFDSFTYLGLSSILYSIFLPFISNSSLLFTYFSSSSLKVFLLSFSLYDLKFTFSASINIFSPLM